MPEVSSGRQRLKLAARLIENHLSDLQLLFDKDLLNVVGQEGSQCMLPSDSSLATVSPPRVTPILNLNSPRLLPSHS